MNFQPSSLLQFLLGLSICFISGGASWSMISGSLVKFQAVGATLSVGERLKEVEEIRDQVEETVEELKQEERINQQEFSAYQLELEQAESLIEETEIKIEEKTTELIGKITGRRKEETIEETESLEISP